MKNYSAISMDQQIGPVNSLSGFQQLNIDLYLMTIRGRLIRKRVFDVFVSAMGLTLLSPILLWIALIIEIDTGGPVLFKQIRVGRNQKPFKIYKFRTMCNDAEKRGMSITVGHDPRITKSGEFLRKYKLDELLQLVNVFLGQMSLVGPRPEVPKYVEMYDDLQKNILKIRPGITDLASISYIDENDLLAESTDPEDTYIHEIMPKKIELNFEYINKLSISFDFRLILRTLLALKEKRK